MKNGIICLVLLFGLSNCKPAEQKNIEKPKNTSFVWGTSSLFTQNYSFQLDKVTSEMSDVAFSQIKSIERNNIKGQLEYDLNDIKKVNIIGEDLIQIKKIDGQEEVKVDTLDVQYLGIDLDSTGHFQPDMNYHYFPYVHPYIPRSLQLREKYTLPLEFSLYMNGIPYVKAGEGIFTYVGDTIIDDHTVAIIEGEFSVKNNPIDTSYNIVGDFSEVLRGTGRYYFDFDAKAYHQIKVKMKETIKCDVIMNGQTNVTSNRIITHQYNIERQ